MPDIRDALLDAAYDIAVTTGWQRARMADVASAAGVSRQTLYDQFGGREGLALHLALRETARFVDGVERAMDRRPDDVVAAIEAAASYALTAARDNPLIRSILTEDGDAGLLPYLTTRAEPMLAAARQRLVKYLAHHWPDIDGDSAVEAAEVVVRLALSYIVLPGPAPAAAARRIASIAARLLDLDVAHLERRRV
ncbi:MAG TPA: TetR family transcriptional regulator [Frankiaceae bacterium]|jgi:AcrR family transcriptional regulator|nr:TetR family transcriptional regulator [Frankiaceae bacterium]